MKCAQYGLSSTKLRATKNWRSSLTWQVCLSVRLKFALRMEQTAVIKETLRMAVPTPIGLPRVVPPSGAVISGVDIPGGVSVSCPSVNGSYLTPLADGCEPEPSFCIIFGRGL